MKTGSKIIKSGFTLIEMTIVFIVLGILVSIAVPRYILTVERGRTAEAHKALGVIRDMELAYFVENSQYTNAMASLNLAYPAACDPNYFFRYSIGGAPGAFTATATRCPAGGKPPQGPAGGYILTINDVGTVGGTARYL